MSDRIEELRKKMNKKEGVTVTYNLSNFNPSDVKRWIPTGSRWLDSIIASKDNLIGNNAKIGGIPVGKIVEIAGEESAGKSYLAAQIAVNAQKMGIDVVWFDSEASMDSTFIKRMGVDLDSILYIPAINVENVMQQIEDLMKESSNSMIFIWDSLGMTPSIAEAETAYDKNAQLAVKARVLSVSMAKLVDSINKHGSTFAIINQLMTNIDVGNIYAEPFETPGGKKVKFAYSLRLWLTGRKAKKWKVEDAAGNRIGSDIQVEIKKSRFGSEGRKCNFKILWSGPVIAIQDEESWLDAIKFSDKFENAGAWYKMKNEDGTETKFQGSQWLSKLETDQKFRDRVIELLDECLIK